MGKARNDEELGFFYTGDVLCLSVFPCGQQDQPKDTKDLVVVMDQAANPTSSLQQECRRICATVSHADHYCWVHSHLYVSKSVIKRAELFDKSEVLKTLTC